MVPLDEAPELFAADDANPPPPSAMWKSCWRNCPKAKRALVRAIKLDGATWPTPRPASGLSESAVKVTVHRAIKSLTRRW